MLRRAQRVLLADGADPAFVVDELPAAVFEHVEALLELVATAFARERSSSRSRSRSVRAASCASWRRGRGPAIWRPYLGAGPRLHRWSVRRPRASRRWTDVRRRHASSVHRTR